MIDHVSIAVRDLDAAAKFYESLLAPLGMTKVREWPNAAVGFGKQYPEFWINLRPDMMRVCAGNGVHIALRAPTDDAVDAFHAAALAAGGEYRTAPPVCAPNTINAITRRSFAIWTAIVSRR